MNILAVDTSTRACVLGVRSRESGEGGENTWADEVVLDRTHSKEILPRIEALLQSAKVEKSNLDLLVYATGFEVQKTGVYNKIVGRGGLDLADKYANGIRTLFGIHSEGYPNLFIMGGYQASFQLNLTYILQSQGDHIAECINYTRKNGYQSIEPSGDAEEWWVQEVIKNRGTTNFNSECTPGYYNFEGESNRRQDGNYNGGFQTYVDFQTEVRANMQENFVFSN